MNTPDRPGGPLPAAWQPAASPPAPSVAEPWDDAPEAGPPPAKVLSAKVVWRAARRHWWQILILWTATSAGLMYLAYNKIKTSYEAQALLIVRSPSLHVFQQNNNPNDYGRYQKTQVRLVTSPDVLGDTLAKHPELISLPMLRKVADQEGGPEAEIRRAMRAQIEPDTHLIVVSLDSEDISEARQIVDAVVESYLKAANTWANKEAQDQIDRLRKESRELENGIDAKKQQLQTLVKNLGNVDLAALQDQARMSMDRFRQYLGELDAIKLRRIKIEGELESARAQAGKLVAKVPQQVDQAQVARLFQEDPRVAKLYDDKSHAEDQVDKARRLAKKNNDPALVAAQNRLKDVNEGIEKLWRKMGPELQKSLMRETTDENDKVLQDLEAALLATKTTETSLQETLSAMKVENTATGGDALKVQFARAELDQDQKLLETLRGQIKQLEFEVKGPMRVDRANQKTQVVPSTNKRIKVMAAAPVGMLGVVLALFVLVEIRSGRVADPDELPSRVRVEVIGVVPPLPSLRPQKALWGSRDEYRARRQLEEFVQSLDHLRVALCSGRKGENRRCVMITSACSSEGKTTLAAHLAGRCANAGLSTVLVDADLRNPSLSRLLKVPDGPGLSDVLRGEMSAEAALMVIEAGGGFHLLPAGTPGYDPSRLLQGDQLGQLIGQLRQAFDLVILDTPPVNLVADALTIGRWTDGALLAVRFDTSRVQLVERAHRRLGTVGVPVIGAVVNGVRTMESSYGYYSYAYHADRAPAGPGTIDVPAERTA